MYSILTNKPLQTHLHTRQQRINTLFILIGNLAIKYLNHDLTNRHEIELWFQVESHKKCENIR